MFDLLVYLFEYHQVSEGADGVINSQAMTLELQEAGFTSEEIDGAFGWLESLVAEDVGDMPRFISNGLRHFSEQEKQLIPDEGRAFLLYLESNGVLDAPARELVIDRLLALKIAEIDIEHVRWVALMVLCNHAKYNELIDWAESIMSGSEIKFH